MLWTAILVLAPLLAEGPARPGLLEPEPVSIVALIATPEKYDGRLVRVIGFLHLEFEGNAIYVHEEDHKRHLAINGLWVDENGACRSNRRNPDGHYALLEGVFNATRKGHTGLWSGAIEKITRCERWE